MNSPGRIGKWILYMAILLILTTAVQVFAEEYACSGSWDTDFENIKRARAMTQGGFARLGKRTLKFEGHINKGLYEKYLETIDDEVKIMIINSPGGDSYDGVRIGLDMAKRSIDVIVDGVAGSSAANYLFTAGRRKAICRGFVGFHGNAGAARGNSAFEDSIRSAAVKSGLGKEKIEKVVKETVALTEATMELEKEFFTKLGISQELFDITQQEAKGLCQGLNLDFEFLLPSIRTMERFGIRKVEGRQDVELAEQLGLAIIYY